MREVFLEGKALPVFPCRADKTPATPHGFKDASADPAVIAELSRRFWGPLVGMPTGKRSGVDVIDIDPRNGGDRWFFEHRADLPQTRTHETRSGGWHLIFRHSPGLRCSASRIAPGVDVKAEGGFVVWWPANCGRVLCEGPVAELPAWLLAASRGGLRSLISPFSSCGDDRVKSASSFAADEKKEDGTLMPPGGVKLPKPLYFKVLELVPLSATVRARDQRRVIGLLRTLTQMRTGRNDALNSVGFAFRELIEAGIVSAEIAERLLFDAAVLNGYVAKDGPAKAIATIRSGLGIRVPSSFFIDQQELDEGTG